MVTFELLHFTLNHMDIRDVIVCCFQRFSRFFPDHFVIARVQNLMHNCKIDNLIRAYSVLKDAFHEGVYDAGFRYPFQNFTFAVNIIFAAKKFWRFED